MKNDLNRLQSHSLFIDRDGVINKRIINGYVTSPEKFEILPGVRESFKIFNEIFKRIIVVTNQQGIGKGHMTEKDLEVIHNLMVNEIEQAGGRIDAIYHCPDLADKENNCRKPNPVMALQAKEDFPEIEFDKSIMAGDSPGDILFGKRLGMKTAFIGDDLPPNEVNADWHFADLQSFATYIKSITEP